MKSIYVLFFFFFLILLMAEAITKNQTYCSTFTCGGLDFHFPFFSSDMPSRCGMFMMNCSDKEIPKIQLEEKGQWYNLKSVSQANTITVTDPRLNHSLSTGACSDLSSFSLPDSPWLELSTLFKCNNNSRKNGFSYANCRGGGGGSSLYYTDFKDSSGCSGFKIPESWLVPRNKNQSYVNATFSFRLTLPQGCFSCHRRQGECKMINNMYHCIGEIKEQNLYQKRILKIGLGVSTALIVMIIMILLVRRKFARKSDWIGEDVESIVMLKRYSYAKVKKMTNSLAHVLGKGGFGTVYKGKLPKGGQDVAVKILKEAKGNREEFINELASMSRTSHVNIVSLLGFCYEGSKRAIIYEFMPNGSLDKFISKNMSTTKIEWEMLYDTAVGVSRGLEYLHNRCVSRIVHFDIKPQNILMDKDLCPKISDFGLARLCKNKESIMSMVDARGTVGYIAPEVFSNNFGGVSHKSDVYSYGMVLLEMIGAKNIENFRNDGSNNSSVYFPDWIYKDIERGEIMRVYGDHITEDEEKIAKKLVLVGLWCIQNNPYDRPSMIKVIEMLEGDLEALQVPPKPLLCLHSVTVPETLDDCHETSSFSSPR